MTRHVTRMTIDDAEHLSPEDRKEIISQYPPHIRDARARGIPMMGVGAIYPIALEDVTCAPFAPPAYWRRAFGMDVGWKRTAAVWGAEDPTDQTIYLYAEHYKSQAVPVIHAEAIKTRGEWIRGAIDPAARQRGQKDGEQLLAAYQGLGLDLVPAKNAVEAGLYECWSRLETGRLKIFSTLQHLPWEYRNYHRDEKGKVVKVNDHLMDAMRYLIMTFNAIAQVQPPDRAAGHWIGAADETAGY